MKRIIYIILILILAAVFLKSCINRDVPDAEDKISTSGSLDLVKIKAPEPYKTVEINGVEYRQSRGEVGKYDGTLNTSTIGEGPKTFNPWNAKDATSDELGLMMFDGLIATDSYTGEVIPLMAKSIDIDKSGMIYTLKLRKGLKWSDGKPITSKDVIFTYKKIIAEGYGNTSMRDNMLVEGEMPEVKAIDDLTVQFITPKPFAPFLRQLGVPIAPKHILEPVMKQGKPAFDAFWGVTTKPDEFVTSGKFRLSRYITAQRIEFVRNPNYYMIDRKGQKLPYLDKYITHIVGDLNNEVLKFEAGQLDLINVRGANVERFIELQKRSNYKMYNLGPDTGTMFMTFNLNNRKDNNGKYYVNPIKQYWFNDYNFRKAVDYSIDRENMVANILRGVGAPLFTPEGLSSIFLNHTLKNGHQRDIRKSKELLAKSGFYWDKKGFLHDKKGNMVEFNLYTNAGNTERESVGVMVKQDLQELGIKVNFKPIEFNVLVGKLVDSFDWDVVVMGLTGSPLEPHGGKNVWNSSGTLHMFNQRKGMDLETKEGLLSWEKELDEVFELGAKTIDLNQRKKVYYRYQEIAYDKLPFIYLYSGLRINAVRNKFGNLNPTPLGGVIHNLEEIYVKE